MARQVTGDFRGLVSVAIPVLRSFRDGFGREISHVDTPRIHQGFSRIGVDVSYVLHDFCLRTVSCSPARTARSPVSREPKPGSAENRVAAEDPKPKDLQSEIEAVKAENAAVRELLRKMEEQQKILLEQVDRLQRRLDGGGNGCVDRRPANCTADNGRCLGAGSECRVEYPTGGDRFSKYFRTAGIRCRTTGR